MQNLIGGKQILSKFSVTHIRTKNINFTVLITNTFNIYILHLTTQNVVCPQHYFQQFFPHLSFLLVHTALSCFSAGSWPWSADLRTLSKSQLLSSELISAEWQIGASWCSQILRRRHCGRQVTGDIKQQGWKDRLNDSHITFHVQWMALMISIIGPSYANLLGFTNINGERSRKKWMPKRDFGLFLY